MSRPSQPELLITVAAVAVDRCRVTLVGDLDLATAPGLSATVASALGSTAGRDLVLDLRGLAFLDAAGLGALARLRQICQRLGGRMTIFGARGMVAELLHLTGLTELVGPVLPADRLDAVDRPRRAADEPPR